MDLIRQAAANGKVSSFYLAADPDVEPLRQRDDFQALLRNITFPTDPFAR